MLRNVVVTSRLHIMGLGIWNVTTHACGTYMPRAIRAGGRHRIEVEDRAGPSAIMVEEDGIGFLNIGVGIQVSRHSGPGDLEVAEYHTRTPRAVARWSKRTPQRPKQDSWPTML